MIAPGTEQLLAWLCCGGEPGSAPRVVLVAAHPDDEVVGAGAQLSRWRGAQLIHVTDGAPRNLYDTMAAGFTNRQDYARVRRKELESALALAGIRPAQLYELGFVDQETSLHLADLVGALLSALRKLQPSLVITHPYEGGHPDHDATAFAVHAVCHQLQQQDGWAPALFEMTSYFNRAGIMASGEFLPRTGWPETTLRLTEAQQEFKRQLYERFLTQQQVLSAFPIEYERFRPAPRYDFTQPPHQGVLYYEMFDWGMTGARWRSLAQTAFGELRCRPGAQGSKAGGSGYFPGGSFLHSPGDWKTAIQQVWQPVLRPSNHDSDGT